MEEILAKTIVNKTKNGFWFETMYNMNIYRGCTHGCIYCDSRSECYHIDSFDKIYIKKDALSIIRNDLRQKKVKGVINTGSMSDPYNPLEKELCLTRHALELISAYGFGVVIATKSDLVVRDIDILKEIQSHSPVLVMITITTVSDSLSAKIEPNVIESSKRFEALKKLSDAGIPTCLLLMPMLPWITDDDEAIQSLVETAEKCGVKYIFAMFGTTFRDIQRDHYYACIDDLFPGLSDKYRKKYGNRYMCQVPLANNKKHQFEALCKSYGIRYTMESISFDYQKNYRKSQLSLFK